MKEYSKTKDVEKYNSETQKKNLAWFLPRPRPDHYKGGMPLYCEEWLIELAKEIFHQENDYVTILNVFSGMNKYGYRVDIKPEVYPDLCCDIHELSDHINSNLKFDIVIADPPYSNDESKELYGTPKINYKKWTAEVEKSMMYKSLLIVYHKYVMPNPNPDVFKVMKRVFIGNRTYHLPRCAIFFGKGF
jgi:hypothetical protein